MPPLTRCRFSLLPDGLLITPPMLATLPVAPMMVVVGLPSFPSLLWVVSLFYYKVFPCDVLGNPSCILHFMLIYICLLYIVVMCVWPLQQSHSCCWRGTWFFIAEDSTLSCIIIIIKGGQKIKFLTNGQKFCCETPVVDGEKIHVGGTLLQ